MYARDSICKCICIFSVRQPYRLCVIGRERRGNAIPAIKHRTIESSLIPLAHTVPILVRRCYIYEYTLVEAVIDKFADSACWKLYA